MQRKKKEPQGPSEIFSSIPYEKPEIVRLGHPYYAKHGWVDRESVPSLSQIDGNEVEKLVSQFGSPLFVFSEKKIIEQFERAKKAFLDRYPKVTFGWSYKTNYLRSVCRVFHRLGAKAEVVSDFEYEQARFLGVPGPDIIFNGPFKPYAILKRAVTEGARVHIDSLDELNDLEQIAQETGIRPQVAIRLNLATQGISPWSRFGFNLENGQAWSVIERLFSAGHLQLSGLHTHLGTFVLDPHAYETAVIKLVALAKDIQEKYGEKISYLDLGGGFPSQAQLKGVYQPPEVAVPPIEAYAQAITSTLRAHWFDSTLPELVLESGRHLIDEAGYLVTSVVAEKLLPDSRRAYVLDAGVNLLYTSTWYRPKIFLGKAAPQPGDSGTPTPSILLGPLCMNIDVVCESLMIRRLKRFEPLVLHPVGAYNVTQWMQFIQYRPAVILIGVDQKARLIRKRENLEVMGWCDQGEEIAQEKVDLPPDSSHPRKKK
ncbi:MAG: alanine racemase [Bdellovibrionia bacterium]